MKAYIFDIETDGLDPSVVHMVAIGNLEGKVKVFENIDKAPYITVAFCFSIVDNNVSAL